jgi:hypothetical protein
MPVIVDLLFTHAGLETATYTTSSINEHFRGVLLSEYDEVREAKGFHTA